MYTIYFNRLIEIRNKYFNINFTLFNTYQLH